MLSIEIVREIRRLLNLRVPQRKIAARLGVSRSTVLRIDAGPPRRRMHTRYRKHIPPSQCPIPDAGLPTRCPLCGETVHMPCRACLAKLEGAERDARKRERTIVNSNSRRREATQMR